MVVTRGSNVQGQSYFPNTLETYTKSDAPGAPTDAEIITAGGVPHVGIQCYNTVDGIFYERGLTSFSAISGGGATTLATLTDVAVSSPTNTQLLAYNSSLTKWQNRDATSIAGVPKNVVDVGNSLATAGDGSSGNPWTGWDAAGKIDVANTTYLFVPGSFNSAGFTSTNNSRQAYLGYGPNSTINLTAYGDLFHIQSSSGGGISQMTFDGLHIVGPNLADSGSLHQQGIWLDESGGNPITHWSVTRCIIEAMGAAGNANASEGCGVAIRASGRCRNGLAALNRILAPKISGITCDGPNTGSTI